MAIQFQCPACSQPIEIDPEWGGKAVVCPYCHKTVTAPRESTYDNSVPQAPVARRAPNRPAFEAVSAAPAVPQYVQPHGRNLVAVWALVLSLSSLACLITGSMILFMNLNEPDRLANMNAEGKSYTEISEAVMEQLQDMPPGSLIGVGLVVLLAFGLWVAGVVCGIIGVRREPRRKFAIAALVVSGLVFLLVVPKG